MSCPRRRVGHRVGCLGTLVLLLRAFSIVAYADAWVPSAGNGAFDFSVRQYDATKVFLPNQFSSAMLPGSEQRYTMLRITGEHGLGHRLSIEYDLRAAQVEKIRVHHHKQTTSTAVGVEDQEIGLNFALTQRHGFADSLTLNVVAATGSVKSVPELGVGHTALEPDFQVGIARSGWELQLKTGSRVFLDSGIAQMRAELDAGIRLTQRLRLGAILFYVRTIGVPNPTPLTDAAERYDLLRPGVELKYRITSRLKPFVEFEQDVSGQAIHGGRRITLGVTYAY